MRHCDSAALPPTPTITRLTHPRDPSPAFPQIECKLSLLTGPDKRDAVVDAAKAEAADLVILGRPERDGSTRGQGPAAKVQSWFRGGLRDYCVQHSHCAVLVVPMV